MQVEPTEHTMAHLSRVNGQLRVRTCMHFSHSSADASSTASFGDECITRCVKCMSGMQINQHLNCATAKNYPWIPSDLIIKHVLKNF